MVLNYTMETYKPELPSLKPVEKAPIESKSHSPMKKEALTLTKFDKVLLGLSKQKLTI